MLFRKSYWFHFHQGLLVTNDSTKTVPRVKCINGIIRFADALECVGDVVIDGQLARHATIDQFRNVLA